MKSITPRKSPPKKIFVGICIILLASAHFFSADAAVPAIEREALIAFYNSTNGDNWTFNSGWKTPPLHTDGFAMPGTECSWSSIGCNSGNTAVEWIELYDNRLAGNLPPELGNLANLEELDIYGNQLTGSIPPELGKLANLKFLGLSGKLSGSIPPELGKLESLRGLSLSLNKLTGSIPPELGKLAKLNELSIFENQLTGSIPPELGKLTFLQFLQLGSNQLTGSIPIKLMQLINLSYLYICDNHLYTNDPDLQDFLTDLAPGWENCQSLPQQVDFDDDGDVDGADLKSFTGGTDGSDLGVFSDYFGGSGWH